MIRKFHARTARLTSRRRRINDEDLDRLLAGLTGALTAIAADLPRTDPVYVDRLVEWLQARDAMRATETPAPTRRHGTAGNVLDPATRLEVVAARWGLAIGAEAYIAEDHSPELPE